MLKAGAGRVPIALPVELFPTEGFGGIHDEILARALILESGISIAIVSLELTSVTPEMLACLQKIVSEITDLPSENVLLCVTHTFSTPHFKPSHLCKISADQQKNDLLFTAVENALRGAVSQAMINLAPARMGCGSGTCDVNVNRDIETSEGWWLGSNETGSSDKTVMVLRFETMQSEPIAILFNYSVQPSVMDGSITSSGHRLVSADLAGAASRFLEKEYENALTAIFCPGASGDQAPSLKAKYNYAGKDEQIHTQDIGEQGFILAEMLGTRLGIEVLRIAENITCTNTAEPIRKEKHFIKCPGQIMPDTHDIHPTKQYVFEHTEDRAEPVELLTIGGTALVGVRPELSCQIGQHIREQSPYPHTLVMTMINGGAKYMAESSAYDRITYEAMNSPFARGAAEIMSQKILELLQR